VQKVQQEIKKQVKNKAFGGLGLVQAARAKGAKGTRD